MNELQSSLELPAPGKTIVGSFLFKNFCLDSYSVENENVETNVCARGLGMGLPCWIKCQTLFLYLASNRNDKDHDDKKAKLYLQITPSEMEV